MASQQLLLGVGAKKKTYVEDVFSIDKYYADPGNYINVVNGIAVSYTHLTLPTNREV